MQPVHPVLVPLDPFLARQALDRHVFAGAAVEAGAQVDLEAADPADALGAPQPRLAGGQRGGAGGDAAAEFGQAAGGLGQRLVMLAPHEQQGGDQDAEACDRRGHAVPRRTAFGRPMRQDRDEDHGQGEDQCHTQRRGKRERGGRRRGRLQPAGAVIGHGRHRAPGPARLLLAPLLAAACATLPRPAAVAAGPYGILVHVVRRGWHTDIAVPVAGPGWALIPELASLARDFPGLRHLVFGFGDRAYLLEPGAGPLAMLRALLPGRGAILLTALAATPEAAFGPGAVVELPLAGPEFAAAAAVPRGQPRPGWPGPRRSAAAHCGGPLSRQCLPCVHDHLRRHLYLQYLDRRSARSRRIAAARGWDRAGPAGHGAGRHDRGAAALRPGRHPAQPAPGLARDGMDEPATGYRECRWQRRAATWARLFRRKSPSARERPRYPVPAGSGCCC